MMDNKSKFLKLKEGEREARREILIEATLDLFGKKPFDEIGVRDIAAAVGVSPASMYRYFPSREDLFVEAFIKDLREIEKWLANLLDSNEDLTLEEFSESLIRYLIDSEPTFQMMSYLMIKGTMTPDLLRKYNGVQRAMLNKFEQVLKRNNIECSDRIIAHAFYASLNGILMTFRNYPGRTREEIEKHINRLSAILCAMLRASSGA
jgi:AcrR family transcriptional regulator